MSLTNSNDNNGKVIVADLTNISTRKDIPEMREKLYELENFVGESTPIFAVYEYNQDLIKTNSNLPIFVGNPKLFDLMNDINCKTKEKVISDKKVSVRQIKLNGKIIELVRFGDIADIRVGLQTGDNDYYLFQNPNARGNYKNIEEYKEFLLTEKDLEKITNNNILRMKIIENGFHKAISDKNFDKDLWFNGKFIIPYDKGGESDIESGWLPNYYVPTDYFIDWSQDAVKKMQKAQNSRFQNKEYYFLKGITWSLGGFYSPTFRLSGLGVFDVMGSRAVIMDENILIQINAIVSSKLGKFLMKNYLDHTIILQIDELKEMPLFVSLHKQIEKIVENIIEKQKTNPRYDYMSNEQKEIDKLVYEMYGLNKDDIREVETWYARRYPKLARFCDIN
jgi:hypothetical protein